MKIGLLLDRLNAFSYFIPLVSFFDANSIEYIFLFSPDKENLKYNSVRYESTKPQVLEYLNKNKISYSIPNSNEELFESNIDFLLSVEGSGYPNVDLQRKFKHIIIQNYFDFTFSMQYPSKKYVYDKSDAMWFFNQFFADIASSLGYSKPKFCGFLPNLWEYPFLDKDKILTRNNLKIPNEKRIATCFLPHPGRVVEESWKDVLCTPTTEAVDWGDRDKFANHAFKTIEELKKKDFFVVLKQKTKFGDPTFKDFSNYIEDKFWYPSTSLDLSYVSDISFGYVSSTIMHNLFFKSTYCNFYENCAPMTEKIFKFLSQNNTNIFNFKIDERPEVRISYVDKNISSKKDEITKLFEALMNFLKNIK